MTICMKMSMISCIPAGGKDDAPGPTGEPHLGFSEGSYQALNRTSISHERSSHSGERGEQFGLLGVTFGRARPARKQRVSQTGHRHVQVQPRRVKYQGSRVETLDGGRRTSDACEAMAALATRPESAPDRVNCMGKDHDRWRASLRSGPAAEHVGVVPPSSGLSAGPKTQPTNRADCIDLRVPGIRRSRAMSSVKGDRGKSPSGLRRSASTIHIAGIMLSSEQTGRRGRRERALRRESCGSVWDIARCLQLRGILDNIPQFPRICPGSHSCR